MATTIKLSLTGKDEVKRGLQEVAQSIKPVDSAVAALSAQTRVYKDIAQQAVETSAAGYRKVAAAQKGMEWHKFVAEMTVAIKQEQALGAESYRLGDALQSVGNSASRASVGLRAGGAGAHAMGRDFRLGAQGAHQLAHGLKDLVVGDLRNATRSFAGLAMGMGGVAGVATSLAVSAIPMLIKEFGEGAEAASKFKERMSELQEERSKYKEMRGAKGSKEGYEKLGANLDEQRDVRLILTDEDASAKTKEEAQTRYNQLLREEGQIRAQTASWVKVEAIERKRAADEYYKNNSLGQRQVNLGREYAKQSTEIRNNEAGAAKARRDGILKSDDLAKLVGVQSEMKAELSSSSVQMGKLNSELLKAKDAKAAEAITEQMKKLQTEIKKTQKELDSLNQRGVSPERLQLLQRVADAEEEMRDKKRAKELEKEKAALHQKEADAKAHIERMKGILSGKDSTTNKSIVDQALGEPDRKKAVENLAEKESERARQKFFTDNKERAARIRDKQETANNTGDVVMYREAEADRRRYFADAEKAAAEARRDVNRRSHRSGKAGLTEDQGLELQAEERRMQAENARSTLNTLKKNGNVSQETLQALQEAIQEQLRMSGELEFQAAEVRRLRAELEANKQKGDKRRAQGNGSRP